MTANQIQRKRKKKNRIKRIMRLIIISAIVVISLIKLVQWNFFTEEITYSLEYGEITIEDDYRALVIRKELILTSNSSGEITEIAKEGEKIKKNQRILDIKNTDLLTVGEDSETLSTDLNIPESVEIVDLTIEQIDGEIRALKEDIATKIHNNEFKDVQDLSESLKFKIDRRRLMSEKSDDVVSSYSENEVGSGSLSMGESESIYSPESGILTYYIDDYEDDLTYERVIYLEYSQFDMLKIEPYKATSSIVKAGDKICKIIDDSSWYLVIVVDKGNQNQFDVNRELEVSIGDRVIKGYIEEIFPTSDRVALAIKFIETVDNFYKDRFLNVKITQESFKGLKINNTSLAKLNDEIGVFVVDKYKNIIFKPVKIIKKDGSSSIIKEDAFYEFIDGENVRIDTVSIYDRVVIDSEGYAPGDVLD